MKILLIHPAKVGALGLQDMTSLEPLALELVAASLADHDVRLLDLRKSDTLAQDLDDFRPDACGISACFTTEVYAAQRIAAAVKEWNPRCFTFVGGHHPSLSPQDCHSSQVDAVVCGEGEVTTPELAQCLAQGGDLRQVRGLYLNQDGGQLSTGPREMIASLDDLPAPRRDLTRQHRHDYFWGFRRPLALLETARGCPYRCNFCSVWCFYNGRVRAMSPERVLREVVSVPEKHIFFTDDNFLLSVQRAEELAALLKREGVRKTYGIQARTDTVAQHPELMAQWKEIGLDNVFLGIEKLTEDGLRELNKRNALENNEQAIEVLKGLEIGFTGNFIVDPNWDHAQFADLREFVTSRQLFNSSFTILTPLPGTLLHEELRGQLTSQDYELFDLWHAVLPTRLDLREFYREFAGLWLAATQSRPRVSLLRRLVRVAKQVITREASWRHLRAALKATRSLQDPLKYLLAHQPRTPAARQERL